MKNWKTILSFISLGIAFIGLFLLKRTPIGYFLAIAGMILFVTFAIIMDEWRDKGIWRKEKSTAEMSCVRASYEMGGEILIYDVTTYNYIHMLWYNYREDYLRKEFGMRVGTNDFEMHEEKYTLPKHFLEEYTIDDLYYFLRTHKIEKVEYEDFIAYNTLLIEKFDEPFAGEAALRIVAFEAQQEQRLNKEAKQREKQQKELETHADFIAKTQLLFFCGPCISGKKIVSVRQEKETGVLYEVKEIPTGRGTGFLHSEPEYIFECSPREISGEEFSKMKSKPQEDYYFEHALAAANEEDKKNLSENEADFKQAVAVFLDFRDNKTLRNEKDTYMPKVHDIVHRDSIEIIGIHAQAEEMEQNIRHYLQIKNLLKSAVLRTLLEQYFMNDIQTYWSMCTTLLLIKDDVCKQLLKSADKSLFDDCRENKILIVSHIDGIFFDCVGNNRYIIEKHSDMGMADDAAQVDDYCFKQLSHDASKEEDAAPSQAFGDI